MFRFFPQKCLCDGVLVDIGRPYDLLQDANSILSKLVARLDTNEIERLSTIAKNHLRIEPGVHTDAFVTTQL